MYYNSSYLCSIKLTKENMKSIRKKIENIVKQINDNMKSTRVIVCFKISGCNTYISSSTGVSLVHYGSPKETLDNLLNMVQ